MLQVKRDELADALAAANLVIQSRNSIPILANVLLDAAGGCLTVSATDIDMTVSRHIDIAPKAKLKTTIPGKPAAKFLSTLDCEELGIEIQGDGLALNNGTVKMKVPMLPAEDFPRLDAGEGKAAKITLPAPDLLKAFDAVSFAISTEETRYYLNGVYFTHHEGRVRMVATDGHRMAVYDSVKTDKFPDCIVPRLAVAAIRKRLAKVTTDVEIAVCAGSPRKRKCRFSWGRESWLTKTIDGTFPDYQRICPSDFKAAVAFQTKDALKALTMIGKASEAREASVSLEYKDGTLTLAHSRPESGTITADIPASEGHGTDGVARDWAPCGFNGGYLIDALKAIDSPWAMLHQIDPASPVKIAGDNPDVFVVQMPMRV